MANCPIKKVKAKHVRMLRDRKNHVPEGANNRVRALRKLFAWAMSEELIDNNPARDCAYIRVARSGHHSWTEDEVRQFEERYPIGTRAHLAMAVMLFTGTRRSDAVLLGKQHVRVIINPETGAAEKWLKFIARKNRNRKPVTIEIPLLQDLQDVIAQSSTSDLAFISTDAGKPFRQRRQLRQQIPTVVSRGWLASLLAAWPTQSWSRRRSPEGRVNPHVDGDLWLGDGARS